MNWEKLKSSVLLRMFLGRIQCAETPYRNSWGLTHGCTSIWDVASQSDGLNFLSSIPLLPLDRTVYTLLISFDSNAPNNLEFNWFQHQDMPLTCHRRFLPHFPLCNLFSSLTSVLWKMLFLPNTILQTSCPNIDFSLLLPFLYCSVQLKLTAVWPLATNLPLVSRYLLNYLQHII